MIDTRWGDPLSFVDTYVHSPGSEGGFQMSPYKIVRPDMKDEEALFVLRCPDEELQSYLKMDSPQFDLRWAGLTTGYGPLMVMIFDLWDAADPSSAHTNEVFPDPLNLVFRKLYMEMATYSHLHMGVLNDESKVCRWIEMQNHFRLDKFVEQSDDLAEEFTTWRHRSAKELFFEVADPAPLHQAMREHRDKEVLLQVRVEGGRLL